jgi:hypothetical protein
MPRHFLLELDVALHSPLLGRTNFSQWRFAKHCMGVSILTQGTHHLFAWLRHKLVHSSMSQRSFQFSFQSLFLAYFGYLTRTHFASAPLHFRKPQRGTVVWPSSAFVLRDQVCRYCLLHHQPPMGSCKEDLSEETAWKPSSKYSCLDEQNSRLLRQDNASYIEESAGSNSEAPKQRWRKGKFKFVSDAGHNYRPQHPFCHECPVQIPTFVKVCSKKTLAPQSS